MKRVEFDPSTLTGAQAEWWDRWQARAARAKRDVAARVRAGEAPKFNRAIWADLKEWMFEHVFGKCCAYCQGKAMGQAFGVGEHWRPKAEVTEHLGDGLVERVNRQGEDHPGYWWLAYEWTNLLPSCERCNNAKASQFPVGKSHVFEPADGESVDVLDGREDPLLLHPLRGEDPAHHVAFDQFGGAFPRNESRLGRVTIEVFDLGRGDLVEERLECLEMAKIAVDRAAVAAIVEGRTFDEAIGAQLEGTPFSAAVLPHVEHWRDGNRERM